MQQRPVQQGFTLIELLIVIAIIGILSSVVLVSLSSAREKARDANRKTDLKNIQLALELYYDKCGSYVVRQNCTGAAYGSGGVGWFNHPYTATGSVGRGLVDHGFFTTEIRDPSGVISSNGVDRSGYMIYVGGNYYTLWANLENPSASDLATQSRCVFSNYDNYYSNYGAASRMNYCISN